MLIACLLKFRHHNAPQRSPDQTSAVTKMKPLPVIRKSISGCVLAAACSLYISTETLAEENAALARARQLVSERCITCHGPTGLSTTVHFPKLAAQNHEYLVKQMFNFQSGARRSVIMAEQMSGLTGNDIEALARYFSLQTTVPEPRTLSPANRLGRKIYFDGKPASGVSPCQTCHGPDAHGAQMLPRLAGQHATYLSNQLVAFKQRTRSSNLPNMHMVVRNLSHSEITAVSHYLSSLD